MKLAVRWTRLFAWFALREGRSAHDVMRGGISEFVTASLLWTTYSVLYDPGRVM